MTPHSGVFKTLRLLTGIIPLTFSAAVFAQTSSTQSGVYTLVEGKIQLNNWADESVTSQPARLNVNLKDFEKGNVYRDQLLLEDGTVQTEFLNIPADVNTISITARSRPAGDTFPRLRITLVTEDNNRHRIYEGYWQSISMETRKFPVNEWIQGKKARLSVDILNAGRVEEQRTWYLQAVSFF